MYEKLRETYSDEEIEEMLKDSYNMLKIMKLSESVKSKVYSELECCMKKVKNLDLFED